MAALKRPSRVPFSGTSWVSGSTVDAVAAGEPGGDGVAELGRAVVRGIDGELVGAGGP